MTAAPQTHETIELSEVCLRLREDLEFTLQQYGKAKCFVVEDRVNGRFYRIGVPEYVFASLLDGKTTIRQAVGETAEILGQDAFSEDDAAGICKWLVDCQLAASDGSCAVDRLTQAAQKEEHRQHANWLNPLMVKWPLGNPESLLNAIAPWVDWLLSRQLLVVWTMTSVVAIHLIIRHWRELAGAADVMLASNNWLWLTVTFVALKLVHELSHALTCRKFGGNVRETGIVFIVFAPIPYVDVTSSWRFSSKWQRIATSAAGMYAELFIAAIAVIVWSNVDHALVQHHACNVMLTAGVATILFNANFLMRFDGYYILVDLLEIPNLYSLGQQYLTYLGRRYGLGIKATAPRWPLGKAAIVRVYGIGAFLWRIAVCITIIITAGALFHGAGMLLAVLAVIVWLGIPLVRFAKYLLYGSAREKPSKLRFGLAVATFAAVAFVLMRLPMPGGVKAPAVVRYAPATIVRVESPGSVRQLHVATGDSVKENEVLIVIDNPHLQQELDDLRLAIRQSLLRSRALYRQARLSAYQAENETRAALESRAAQREREVKQLVIRAPISGQIISRNIDSLLGRHVPVGEELLTIADPKQKELLLLIAQDDYDAVASEIGTSASFSARSIPGSKVPCELDMIDPRATDIVVEPALAATSGGPLPVRPELDHHDGQWRLIEPRFLGTARLTDRQSSLLRAGQSGAVKLDIYRTSIGEFLFEHGKDWLRRKIQRAHGLAQR